MKTKIEFKIIEHTTHNDFVYYSIQFKRPGWFKRWEKVYEDKIPDQITCYKTYGRAQEACEILADKIRSTTLKKTRIKKRMKI